MRRGEGNGLRFAVREQPCTDRQPVRLPALSRAVLRTSQLPTGLIRRLSGVIRNTEIEQVSRTAGRPQVFQVAASLRSEPLVPYEALEVGNQEPLETSVVQLGGRHCRLCDRQSRYHPHLAFIDLVEEDK